MLGPERTSLSVFYRFLRCRAAYAATLSLFPHNCMLHQRRVPFLLVSWKWSTQLSHLRMRLRSPAANNVAAPCVNGANKSAGSRTSNHNFVEHAFPFVIRLVSMG